MTSRARRTKRVRYTEEDDDEIEYIPRPQARPSRSVGQVRYRELSDDSDAPLTDPSSDSEPEPTSQPVQRAPSARKQKPIKRKYPTRAKQPSFNLFQKKKPNTVLAPPEKSIVFPLGPSGKAPRWQDLPYEALLVIMKHAAYPLYSMASRSTGSVEWLCQTSLLSRSFHDACMAALLYSPPLYPAWRAQGLLRLLQRHESKTVLNCSTKIRRLDIEVKNLLLAKNGIDLEELIRHTPNLEHLRLYHNHDDLSTYVWAQPSASKHRKWAYSDELFDAMDANKIFLKSFEWNGRFPTPMDTLQTMAKAHTRPCFSKIENLSILNIEIPEKCPEDELATARDLLSTSLSCLLNLKSLTFKTCNLLDEFTTPQLPHSLTDLNITNNITFLSSHLSTYLATRGSQLTSLTLKHNQSMSLDFLAHLSTYTPRLRHLNLDLTYTDPSSYKDVNPLYDDALPEGPPTWPTTLTTLSIENLRQVSHSEIEDFFNSLVFAAAHLKWLRILSIKAIVRDASWRERADLRAKWYPKLDDIFLDRSVPRNIRSLPPPKQPPPVSSTDADTDASSDNSSTDNRRGKGKGRRSGRLAEVHLRRLTAEHEKALSTEADEPQPSRKERERIEVGRQGRCHIVMLDISDQRPSQEQYREADFLDDEPSDDGDYRD